MSDSQVLEAFPSAASLEALEDEDLVLLLASGQAQAMAVLFDRYYALMMRIALRILRNWAEAEDVVQIAFTDFYRQIELFDSQKGSLRAWLVQYVYGRSINRLRRRRRRRESDHIELSEISSSELAIPDEGVFDLNGAETRRLVEQALATLRGKKRRIVELVCFAGMTITEIAAATGEPHGRLQHRYYRSIEKLRVWMRKAEKANKVGKSVQERPHPEKEESNSKKSARKLSGTEVEIGKAQVF
jgi:RNA polymerase sigma-70 factor, ECF subfamily